MKEKEKERRLSRLYGGDIGWEKSKGLYEGDRKEDYLGFMKEI